MPKTRKNKDRNKNLLKFKQKHKKSIMSDNNANQFQMPPTRQTPTWESTDIFEVSGNELEVFSELMDVSARAYAAYTNIINRGLLNGTVQIQHEKLNAAKNGYELMTDEEAAPLREQVKNVIAETKKIAEETKARIARELEEKYLAKEQEGLPRIDAIVDPTGKEASTEIVEPEQAKIITLE
jgi:hypothetical protein